MRKQELTDNSGRWFDIESAKIYTEAIIMASPSSCTGVSRATGNSWEHETLYLTMHGAFIMHFFDEHNPTLSQFIEWDVNTAVKWLLSNGHGGEVRKLELQNEEKQFEI
jgi:hypothetical protein